MSGCFITLLIALEQNILIQIQLKKFERYLLLLKQAMQGRTVKIVSMSDTHDQHDKIDIQKLPEADIFIHAGDFTQNSYRGQIDRFVTFLSKLPYKHKIVIAGNHDFVLQSDKYETKHKPKRHPYEKMKSENEIEKLKKVCIYLQHEAVQIEGIKIFGSPYQPLFYNWGFQYHQTRAHQIWGTLPSQIDILVTHGPPYGILDLSSDGTHAGCKTLKQKVQQIKPKLHVFGHIHFSSGVTQLDGIQYVNACMVNEAYQVAQPAKFSVLNL